MDVRLGFLACLPIYPGLAPAKSCAGFQASDLNMNQDKDFKSRSKKRKREEGKSPF